MKTWIVSLLIFLSGCAHVEQPSVSDNQIKALLDDSAFAAPSQPVDASKLFDLSPAMRSHLASTRFQALLHEHGQALGLVHALYDASDLKLDYDSSYTGNAAETYASRQGNCLSLVILTAAFARQLDLNVHFQEVQIEDTWSRDHSLYLVSSHVNLSLAPRAARTEDDNASAMLTVDFVPGAAIARQRVRYLSETDIVALYMNNRAAEELAKGRQADAYWWARGALLKKPTLSTAYNTLGVIYQRSGQHLLAEQVFRAALEREPDSLVVLQNLAPLLAANGKTAEAEQLKQRAARLYPAPPYHFFNQGMEAYRAGNIAQARNLFAREVARAPYNDEFHFWLGIANLQLGELKVAEKQLALAHDMSVRSDTRERYAAKLAHLRNMTSKPRRN